MNGVLLMVSIFLQKKQQEGGELEKLLE
jgi:hypothetical protein